MGYNLSYSSIRYVKEQFYWINNNQLEDDCKWNLILCQTFVTLFVETKI